MGSKYISLGNPRLTVWLDQNMMQRKGTVICTWYCRFASVAVKHLGESRVL